MMEKRITLGLHHGVPVVVEFPCSDICPQYTTRIVHYDLAPGAACAAAVVQHRHGQQGVLHPQAADDRSLSGPLGGRGAPR